MESRRCELGRNNGLRRVGLDGLAERVVDAWTVGYIGEAVEVEVEMEAKDMRHRCIWFEEKLGMGNYGNGTASRKIPSMKSRRAINRCFMVTNLT